MIHNTGMAGNISNMTFYERFEERCNVEQETARISPS